MAIEEQDIGDHYAVPEEDRLEVDPSPQYNADAGFDINVVPDGEYATLNTYDDNERAYDDDEYDDSGDGAPMNFVTAEDPIVAETEDEED